MIPVIGLKKAELGTEGTTASCPSVARNFNRCSNPRYEPSQLWQSSTSGQDATPSVGVIDSQPVKTATTAAAVVMTRAKKIKGRERHISTDTLCHVVAAVVHPADIQDHNGAPLAATKIRSLFAWLRHLIGEGGYAGEKLRGVLVERGRRTIEIVKRSDRAEGFIIMPKRWIVEHRFVWLGRCRRFTKHVEAPISLSCAQVMIVHICRVLRQINQTAF